MKLDFAGVYPPITTPFNKDETIAWNKLEENLSKMNAMKLRGYLVQGSNGEYCYLSAEERVEMIRRVKFHIHISIPDIKKALKMHYNYF